MSFIHLKVITKLLTKKRINICDHYPIIIQKGEIYENKKTKLNNEKEKQINK